MTYHFPFGEPVLPGVQHDRTPKRVFVLGGYAGAVHARWLDPTGRTAVNALAVASEPDIFWRGEGTDEVMARIRVPSEAGRLVDADCGAPRFNGPSGRALDPRPRASQPLAAGHVVVRPTARVAQQPPPSRGQLPGVPAFR